MFDLFEKQSVQNCLMTGNRLNLKTVSTETITVAKDLKF